MSELLDKQVDTSSMVAQMSAIKLAMATTYVLRNGGTISPIVGVLIIYSKHVLYQ